MPKQMEGREMRPEALKEIIDAVNAAAEKHHGPDASNLLKTDYAAAVMFYWIDKHHHAQTPILRALAFDTFMGNLKHMARLVAAKGWGGLVLSEDYKPRNTR